MSHERSNGGVKDFLARVDPFAQVTAGVKAFLHSGHDYTNLHGQHGLGRFFFANFTRSDHWRIHVVWAKAFRFVMPALPKRLYCQKVSCVWRMAWTLLVCAFHNSLTAFERMDGTGGALHYTPKLEKSTALLSFDPLFFFTERNKTDRQTDRQTEDGL